MPIRYYRIIIILLTIFCSFNIEANTKVRMRNIKLVSTPPNIIRIDSLDYTKSSTRVYARIMGKPSTSMKIESITGATDIDGIDFKRWFQFEESGIIPIEIDFSKINPRNGLSFDIISSIGIIKCKAKCRK